MARRVAFFICGVMTVLVGRVYSGLQLIAPEQESTWMYFHYVLLIMGSITVCISFLPHAWVQGTDTERIKRRYFSPFGFLLGFAGVGLLLVIVLSFVSPNLVQPSIPLVYSLCPACVTTATVDPSLTTAVFLIGPLNALVIGALGGVIGTVVSIISR